MDLQPVLLDIPGHGDVVRVLHAGEDELSPGLLHSLDGRRIAAAELGTEVLIGDVVTRFLQTGPPGVACVIGGGDGGSVADHRGIGRFGLLHEEGNGGVLRAVVLHRPPGGEEIGLRQTSSR